MKYEIELKPFQTPNFVIQKTPAGNREDGFKEEPKYPIEKIHPEALAELCDEFRRNIFKKAGCKDPGDLRSSGTPKLLR